MYEMDEVRACKYCGRMDYWGQFRWLSGRCICRRCHREEYERKTGKLYEWDDLDGQFPEEADHGQST